VSCLAAGAGAQSKKKQWVAQAYPIETLPQKRNEHSIAKGNSQAFNQSDATLHRNIKGLAL